MQGDTKWMIGLNGLVATSDDVFNDIETRCTMRSILNQTDRFFEVSGNGVLFVNSIGSIIQRQLKRDERWTVRTDHLVACDCQLVEQSRELSKATYIFEGPGVLILQSQSGYVLSKWIQDKQ